jgi:hypothetical protein
MQVGHIKAIACKAVKLLVVTPPLEMTWDVEGLALHARVARDMVVPLALHRVGQLHHGSP